MKNERKIKRITSTILPKQLVDDINNLPLSSILKSHCFKFIGILYRDSMNEFKNLISPTPKSKNYLIKISNSNYSKWLNKLLEFEIVLRSNFYSISNHICYEYQVNPKYLISMSNKEGINSRSALCDHFFNQNHSTVRYNDVFSFKNELEESYFKMFENDFKTLKISYELLYDLTWNHINSITIDDFEVDMDLLPKSIDVEIDGVERYRNVETILKRIKKDECLLKDHKKFRVENPRKFINLKKASMSWYYMNCIQRLKEGSFNVKRNKTNQRLDTNFTNFPSVLFDEICRQNDLVQIDLSNSQFLLLVYRIGNELDTDDFKLFKTLSSQGELYTYIADAENLCLKSPKKSKQVMFEVMFSKYRNNSGVKLKIKELFPIVIKWIDSYKRQYGDNQFSIMLQQIESNLFIDKIYMKIKKKDVLCFTKHDSIIVRLKEYKRALRIMREELKKLKIDYRLKITTPESEYYVY